MTGKDIKELLDRAGVLPSKQLGQNFLIDPNMARWIVSQLEVTPDEAVVEVGPGTGALSEHLIGNCRKLILIEFDARLAKALKERFQNEPSVEIHHADGAKFDGRQLFKHGPVKFLGNLPYSCGGAILKNLLSRPNPFSRAVVMLQKEVIDRLAATPGSKDYGILSLRTQVDWQVYPQRTVPPEAFHPRPTIDSSVAVLIPRTEGIPAFDRKLFDELVRRGFAQRRKQLKKQLPETIDWPLITETLQIPTTARAEELNLSQWIELTRLCDVHPLLDSPQQENELFDVVDENDSVITQAPRREVHQKNLIHRATHVLVFNKRGQLLLQQRSAFKDTAPLKWDSSVSGHLNAGESYADAAIRELQEEMGITAESLPAPLAILPPNANTGWEHVHVFHTRYDGSIHFPSSEIESTCWFPLEEIDAWTHQNPSAFSNTFLTCWRAVRDLLIHS